MTRDRLHILSLTMGLAGLLTAELLVMRVHDLRRRLPLRPWLA